jgi:hypothetical protein
VLAILRASTLSLGLPALQHYLLISEKFQKSIVGRDCYLQQFLKDDDRMTHEIHSASD